MALGKWSLEVLQNSRALFQRRRNGEPPEPTEPAERDQSHWHCCQASRRFQVSRYCRRRACALMGFAIVALRIQYLHERAALLSQRAVITCADMTSLRSALETANSSNWPRFMQDTDNATEERCRDLGSDQELEEPLGVGAGSLVDHFSTEMNKLLPPQYRFDFITLVLVTGALLYLVQTSDEHPTPRARSSHSFALATLTESLALSAVAETQESKAVKRLQAAYFDLVCRMRPDRSGNFQVGKSVANFSRPGCATNSVNDDAVLSAGSSAMPETANLDTEPSKSDFSIIEQYRHEDFSTLSTSQSPPRPISSNAITALQCSESAKSRGQWTCYQAATRTPARRV
ncbi:unnamed protein product [Symbiodinium sp. CCMP2456]|nr:unnamed protein product [Symbiodinium sp. CCMP2456]